MRRTTVNGLPKPVRLALGWSALLILATAMPGRAAEIDSELAEAEKTLREARLATDGPSLLTFFRQRTLTEAQRKKLAATVGRLSDEEFEVRRKAYKDLLGAGRAVVPLLKEALKKSEDAEVVRKATELINHFESGSDLAMTLAAARVLAARKPEGTVKVLLDYIPQANDEAVTEAVESTLAVVGLKKGKPEAAILAALADRESVRRAAAVAVLARAGKDQFPAIRRLLKDVDANVRLRAASVLLRGGDKAAVDTLITLLGVGPKETASLAEDLLCRVAGDQSPTTLDTSTPESRRKGQQDWEKWWKANAARIDLARIKLEMVERGLTVIAEHDGGKDGQGRVWERGKDGKARWVLDSGMGGALDAHVLPNGRLLIAEYTQKRVTERDRQGKVLWEKKLNSNALSCQRLANGNTLIATSNEVLEVDRTGKAVFSLSKPQVYYATRLRNGHTLYTTANQIVELDVAKKEVRAVNVQGINWGTADKLPNGNYLAAAYGSNQVVEIDAKGKIVWSCNVPLPTQAIRLPNGNTLVSSAQNKVAEFTPKGKEVWKVATPGRAWRVRRH